MAYTLFIESYQEFAERHGNHPLNVNEQLLFADGAWCSISGEFRQEPPVNPAELVRAKLRYWREAVKRSTKDFYALRNQCSRDAEFSARYNNLPGPSHMAVNDLLKLREAVLFCRDEVDKLEKELDRLTSNHPDRVRQRMDEEQSRERQANVATLISKINSINI